MKINILLLVLFFSSQMNSSTIPSPSVLFSISDKIVKETHKIVLSTENEIKRMPVKMKPVVENTGRKSLKKHKQLLWYFDAQMGCYDNGYNEIKNFP